MSVPEKVVDRLSVPLIFLIMMVQNEKTSLTVTSLQAGLRARCWAWGGSTPWCSGPACGGLCCKGSQSFLQTHTGSHLWWSSPEKRLMFISLFTRTHQRIVSNYGLFVFSLKMLLHLSVYLVRLLPSAAEQVPSLVLNIANVDVVPIVLAKWNTSTTKHKQVVPVQNSCVGQWAESVLNKVWGC